MKHPTNTTDIHRKSTHAPAGGTLLAAAVFSLLLAAFFSSCMLVWTDIELTALSTNGDYILPDTRFHLKMDGDYTPDELRELIVMEPEIAYDIAEAEEAGWLLTPLRPLDAAGRITITVKETSFTFIVDNQLLLLSSFPGEGGRQVPIRSGIEFTFNTRSLTLDSFREGFSISPAVDGDFRNENGRYIFYPTDGMAYATAYTVTLEKGMTAQDGAVLPETVQLRFETLTQEEEATEWMFQFSKNEVSYNTLPGESPLLQVYMDADNLLGGAAGETIQVDVTLHAFPGWEEYREVLQREAGVNRYKAPLLSIDTAALASYASFSLEAIPAQQGEDYYRSQWLLEFPEALPRGWYAATFRTVTTGGITITRQLLMQSSDLAVFYMHNGDSMVAWINDTATGGPVSGASLEMTGIYEAAGVSDADGVVDLLGAGRYTTQELYETGGSVLTITAGDTVFVDMGQSYLADAASPLSYDYLYYLFTDRPLYHTTDTVQAWGMIRPRVENPRPLGDLVLSVGGGMAEQAVELGEDGTFTAALAYENMSSDYWGGVELRSGEEVITSRYVRIEDFVKPVYTASTQPDRPVYLTTENATAAVSLDVSTFDGTPTARFPVRMSSWGDLATPEDILYTDEEGAVRVSASIVSDPDTWYPQSYHYQFRSDDALSENFYLSSQVYAIHRDVMLTALPEIGGGSASLAVRTNQISIGGITDSGQLWDRENLRGSPVTREVTAELHKTYYTKEIVGTYYDFIHRESRDTVTYQYHDDVVDTLSFTVQNGSHTLENLPAPEAEACYYVLLTTADTTGKPVVVRSYLGTIYERTWYSNAGSPRYVLNKRIDPSLAQPEEDYGGGYRYPFLLTLQSQFEDNESVTFQLENNDEVVTSFSGSILYSVAQDGLTTHGLSTRAAFSLPYSDDLIPNYVITGAYFDGKHIFMLENKYMAYSPRQRELEIQLTTDRASYRPGGQVQVTASVRNKATGAPAADTGVVLSVVDEAIFALQEQDSDILTTLYQSVFYPTIHKYASYTPSDLGGAGEKGGGGGDDNMRTEFEDTAFFSTATTNSAGTATFSLTLPDNITSWRLTSLALSPENHAGNAVANTVATKEFFLLPVVGEQILEGDTLAVGLRSTGAGVSSGDEVSYTVTLEGPGVQETRQLSSSPRSYVSAGFGGLSAGDYTVTIRGEGAGYEDAVQLPLSVVKSGVEVSMVTTVDLRRGIGVEPLRYPVSINVYDKAYQTYNQVLRSVHANSEGARADMRLARRYVATQYEKWGSPWYDPDALSESISDISGASGSLISLFPYSTGDIELTVKAALALPELVSTYGLESRSITDDWYEGSKAAVYLAQVLAGETPAANLSQLLEAGERLSFGDRVYIALALALSGGEDEARAWYDKAVKPHIRETTGISGDVLATVSVPGEALSDADCTAAASMLATVLGTGDADNLARYLAEKPSRYEPYLFEQLLYLTRCEPSGSAKGSFRYTLHGETVTEKLERHVLSLTLTREQLAQADFQVLSGDVYADVYYAGSPDQAADNGRKVIGLTKRVEAVDGGEITVGSVVKITLTPDFSGLDTEAGSASLLIDDYIPSGMRFEQYDRGDFEGGHSGWYMNSRQGQRLQFAIWDVNRRTTPTPIVYYARCASPGEFILESAYISTTDSDLWGASERDRVVIE